MNTTAHREILTRELLEREQEMGAEEVVDGVKEHQYRLPGVELGFRVEGRLTVKHRVGRNGATS